MAKACVARYEAEVKERAQVGELIGGYNVSSDTEVAVVGVENKVTDSGLFFDSA